MLQRKDTTLREQCKVFVIARRGRRVSVQGHLRDIHRLGKALAYRHPVQAQHLNQALLPRSSAGNQHSRNSPVDGSGGRAGFLVGSADVVGGTVRQVFAIVLTSPRAGSVAGRGVRDESAKWLGAPRIRVQQNRASLGGCPVCSVYSVCSTLCDCEGIQIP